MRPRRAKRGKGRKPKAGRKRPSGRPEPELRDGGGAESSRGRKFSPSDLKSEGLLLYSGSPGEPGDVFKIQPRPAPIFKFIPVPSVSKILAEGFVLG